MAFCCQSLIKPVTIRQTRTLSKSTPVFRCNLSLLSRPRLTGTEPEPIYASVKAFALATVAKLGPGFDFLGCVVDGVSDFVSISIDPHVHPEEIAISEITGDNAKKLSKNPLWKCIGIASIEVMKMLNIRSVSLSLLLEKGLPLGSGLKSSAVSTGGGLETEDAIYF